MKSSKIVRDIVSISKQFPSIILFNIEKVSTGKQDQIKINEINV